MKQAAHGFKRFPGSNRWHTPCSMIEPGGASVNTMRRVAMLVVVAVVAWVIPTWSDGQERKYSGTVLSVDRSAGVIVVGDMGPWRIKDGVTQVDRRTIEVTPSTEFVSVRRASGPAPSGWVGDFVESVLPGWQVKPGDWVTVIVKPGDTAADGGPDLRLGTHRGMSVKRLGAARLGDRGALDSRPRGAGPGVGSLARRCLYRSRTVSWGRAVLGAVSLLVVPTSVLLPAERDHRAAAGVHRAGAAGPRTASGASGLLVLLCERPGVLPECADLPRGLGESSAEAIAMRDMLLASLVIGLLLTGCATIPGGPSVMVLPGAGKSFEQFQAEDFVCRQWAAQQIGITPGQASAARYRGRRGGRDGRRGSGWRGDRGGRGQPRDRGGCGGRRRPAGRHRRGRGPRGGQQRGGAGPLRHDLHAMHVREG